MKKWHTVTIDGSTKRVRYTPKRVPASERNAGLLPSRVHEPDTAYQRRSKHRPNYQEDA
jgi:hypothetical protein